MSVKTSLPYKITPYPDFSADPIYLGIAEEKGWFLNPRWVSNKLQTLEIEMYGTYGKFKIDVILSVYGKNNSYSKVDVTNYTTYIEDGQKTTEIETFLLVSFDSQYYEVGGFVTITKCTPEESPSFLGQLSGDLLHLLNNKNSFSDAILICCHIKFYVHKCILSARSSIFADMFKNKLQEGIGGNFTIEDLQVNVLHAMLKYIYSGRIDNLTNVLASELLFAAEKYQLKDLKVICVDKLKSSLRVTNVFTLLILGDSHDKGLKDEAKKFVCKFNKFSELENTAEWNLLRKNHPDLAIELLTFVVNYLQRN